MSKLMKNVQYQDTKFRLIQIMSRMLLQRPKITIGYYISSYTGLFFNIIINQIDEHFVYLSYTLRIRDLQKEYQAKKPEFLDITRVNCVTHKFDQGSIPELDEQWCNNL